jgi:hypothetical protein
MTHTSAADSQVQAFGRDAGRPANYASHVGLRPGTAGYSCRPSRSLSGSHSASDSAVTDFGWQPAFSDLYIRHERP